MKRKTSIHLLAVAVGLALGSSLAQANTLDVVDSQVVMTWSGLFTMLDAAGNPMPNTSEPYYSDPTWGQGYRTPISGTMTMDIYTGAGSFAVYPFEFFNGSSPVEFTGGTLQAIGDGMGDVGSLVLGNALFGWNSVYGNPFSIVWDAAGLFGVWINGITPGVTISGVGAVPASDPLFTDPQNYPIGPAPLATTAWNTYTSACTPGFSDDCMGVNPSGGLPLVADSTAGSPFVAGAFLGFSASLDITSVYIVSGEAVCLDCEPPSPVPLPAAFWLFGSGLAGVMCLSRRGRGQRHCGFGG